MDVLDFLADNVTLCPISPFAVFLDLLGRGPQHGAAGRQPGGAAQHSQDRGGYLWRGFQTRQVCANANWSRLLKFQWLREQLMRVFMG